MSLRPIPYHSKGGLKISDNHPLHRIDSGLLLGMQG
jgi:hypothetical protein